MASEFQERLHPRDQEGKFSKGRGAAAVKGTHGVSLTDLAKQSRAKLGGGRGSAMSETTKRKQEVNAQRKRAKAAVSARAEKNRVSNNSRLLQLQQEKNRATGAVTGKPVPKKKPRTTAQGLRRAYGVKVTVVK